MDTGAKVETDGWKGYNKMKKIRCQIHKKPAQNQFQRNLYDYTKPQVVAGAIPTRYISKEHTKAYLDGLINRMVGHPPINYQKPKLCN